MKKLVIIILAFVVIVGLQVNVNALSIEMKK